ncbi:MAG: efflux RND transporter periplasmic adaptor subunit, partial [Brevundimonas sp.]|nr:efflux RND transporter periplasmic adaptor subunit [Brevundimonas sp.]
GEAVGVGDQRPQADHARGGVHRIVGEVERAGAAEVGLVLQPHLDRRGAAPIQVRRQDETSFSRAGTLDFTDNAVDGSSGVIRLRAVIPNADGFLKPGMFGQARLAGAGTYDAMLVPDAAIATDQARRIVYVAAADGSVTPKPVQLGPLVDGLRIIRSGLERTDRVIINGVQRIQQPGMKVQARNGQIRPVARETQVPVTRAAPASTATFANSLSSGD